jgi:two-component system chemotaxis response regulator CheY
MKSLVVDPSVTAQRVVANLLRRAGCDEVLAAAGLTEALKHWEDESLPTIDLVVTEWDLAEGTGLELVKQLKQRPEESRPSLLMHTARNAREEVLEAIEAGVDGYVLKPPDPGTLTAKIDQLLEPARQAAANDAAA